MKCFGIVAALDTMNVTIAVALWKRRSRIARVAGQHEAFLTLCSSALVSRGRPCPGSLTVFTVSVRWPLRAETRRRRLRASLGGEDLFHQRRASPSRRRSPLRMPLIR